MIDHNGDQDELPVSACKNGIRILNELVEEGRWEECIPVSKRILENVALALNPRKCRTGSPHLDGVYSTGRMHYINAPPNVRRALDKMNRIIRTAKESVTSRR